MTGSEFTADDLRRILQESAGADENIDLADDDVFDEPFDSLGYESLALMETVGQIEREFGIRLDEAVFSEAETPRALLEYVNGHLSAAA